ncbi:MAG TPA: hypothetical protein VF178_11955 [Gemmatimonadaceae bacterium]
MSAVMAGLITGRLVRVAAGCAVIGTIFTIAACNDNDRPTAPSARTATVPVPQVEAQAGKGGGGGLKTYGIQAHGTVVAPGVDAGPPYLTANTRNLLSVTNPQKGQFCVEVAPGVDARTFLVSERYGRTVQAGYIYGYCGDLGLYLSVVGIQGIPVEFPTLDIIIP